MECPSCKTPVDGAQRFCPNCGTAIAEAEAQPKAADPMIGQLLGAKYSIIRLLGEGGMGCVYEGEQKLGTTRRKVAVKTLHPHLSRDAKIKARFEREVGTIAELEHPNTIQVHDFGTTDDGILYIVMEFLQGRSLADLLEKDGAMQPERVAYIMQQICGSLEEAHGRGIVHRDLKPANVVLVERAGKKDFVKVLDFGIAKRSREEDKEEQKLTQQGMVLGTPPYMSPEQFTGRPIDARSDIYSLAVMSYEMLTGRLPFKADTAWEWATQHMTQPPIPIESMAEGLNAPEAMRSAIMRGLQKSPDARFQTVKEYSDAFTGGEMGMRPMMGSSPGLPHARTEMGPPLDVNSAFGRVPTPPPMQPPVGFAPAYTPAAGNVAFPTPAGMPQSPPGGSSGGGKRAIVFTALGLAAAASVGLIVFGMNSVGSGKPSTPANPAPPPTTTAAATTAPPAAPPTVATVIPPLNGTATHVPPHPGPGVPPGVPPGPAAPMVPPSSAVRRPRVQDGASAQTNGSREGGRELRAHVHRLRRRPQLSRGRDVARAASGFVLRRAADEQLALGSHESLGLRGGAAAARAHRVKLGHVFGHGHERGERSKRASLPVLIKAGHDDADAARGEGVNRFHDGLVEELHFVDTNDGHRRRHVRDELWGSGDGIRVCIEPLV